MLSTPRTLLLGSVLCSQRGKLRWPRSGSNSKTRKRPLALPLKANEAVATGEKAGTSRVPQRWKAPGRAPTMSPTEAVVV